MNADRLLRHGARYREETDRVLRRLEAEDETAAPVTETRTATSPAHAGVTVTDRIVDLAGRTIGARSYQATDAGPAPLLLWLHGGGFVGGTLDDIENACLRLARATRCQVVSLDYRLAPAHPYPAALDDTISALAWLADHGAEVGGDGRLAIGGQSAGATLALGALLSAPRSTGPDVRALILCYPWLDDRHDGESWRAFDGMLHDRADLERSLQDYLGTTPADELAMPLRSTSFRSLPATLVLAAGRDPLRDDARRFAEQVTADGGSVRLVEYADTMHAFLNFTEELSAARDAVDDIASFFHAALDRPSP